MKRIALLNFGGIGDEILFSPVIHAVHQAHPEAELTLVLEQRSKSIIELLPQVRHFETINLDHQSRLGVFRQLLGILRRGRYDAVISSGSSPFIAVLLWASGIPVRVGFDSGKPTRMLLSKPAPLNRKAYAGQMYFTLAQTFLEITGKPVPALAEGLPRLNAPPEAIAHARSVLESLESSPPESRIMIHPGVSRMSVQKNILKAWPIACWQALILSLAQRYPQSKIYLLGGPDDAEVIAALEGFRSTLSPELQLQIVSLVGKTRSFQELAGLITLADVLVSVDSAPMHLAVGLNRNVVAIFAPTDPEKLVPKVPTVEVAAREDLACRPCLWDVRKVSCEAPVCLEVPVERVFNKVEALLGRKLPLS